MKHPVPDGVGRMNQGWNVFNDGLWDGSSSQRLDAFGAVCRAMPDGPGSHATRHASSAVDGPAGFDPYRKGGRR